jgi:opacity protein-like surface antigen
MIRLESPGHSHLLWRLTAGVITLVLSLILGVSLSRAGEIVPAVGLMRMNGSEDTKVFGSLAFRGNLAPVLQSEIAIAYRNENRFNDQLAVRMWPVTASLWVTPVPTLYAGGGVGWYHTTLDYDESLPIEDETSEEFGVHLGGGIKVPLGPKAGLDLGGRYVMMREQESQLIPQRFDPDFWMTSVGLAFRF